MRQVRVHAPHDVRIDDVAAPAPGPRDAVVRVAACGICGTDVALVELGGLTGAPMALGHEIAGTVEWVGAEVSGIAIGDRVVVCPGSGDAPRLGSGADEGGLTPSLLVRDAADGNRLFRVPDSVPLHVAALAEPLAVGMQAVAQAEVVAGETVAVFGCGPVGLMTIVALVECGAQEIVAIDPDPARRDLARVLGAAHAVDPTTDDVWRSLRRIHGTVPFRYGPTPATDAFIEASGSAAVVAEILRFGRDGGRMSVVALHHAPVPTDLAMVLLKQFTIRGSFEYPPDFGQAVAALARHDLAPVITHTVSLDDFAHGLELVAAAHDCGKVLVVIDPDV